MTSVGSRCTSVRAWAHWPCEGGAVVPHAARLVTGSGLETGRPRAHQLEGVPGEWHLFAVTSTWRWVSAKFIRRALRRLCTRCERLREEHFSERARSAQLRRRRVGAGSGLVE